MRKKKGEEDEQTLEELNSAHLRSATKMTVSTNQLYLKRVKLFLFSYNQHLINRAKSACMGES